MKILLIAPYFGYFGGIEQYIADCIREFTLLGHHCSLVYGRKSDRPFQQDVTTHLLGSYHLGALPHFSTKEDALQVEELKHVLEVQDPDIIFTSGVKNYQLLSCLREHGGVVPMSHDNWLVCMRISNITYVRKHACVHTLGPRCLQHGCFLRKSTEGEGKGLSYNSLSKQRRLLESYRSIGVHIVASNYIKQRMVQHGFRPEQITVAGYYTGMQPAFDAAHYQEAEPNILFMGRIDRYKGVDYLIRALAHIKVPYRCTVIGDGAHLPYCKSLAERLHVQDRVDFLGWRTRQEIVEQMGKASMVVVPSVWPEAFGIVGIEAMTCSRPVVAFDSGGISDWLKDGRNGYLVPVKDTHALADRMEALLKDTRTAQAMGAEGKRIVSTSFSKHQHFKKLFKAFEEIAAGDTREAQLFQIVC